MSDTAFAELTAQVAQLPMFQIFMLKEQVDRIALHGAQREEAAEPFEFDRLVHHTARADHADEYLREFRDHDRR